MESPKNELTPVTTCYEAFDVLLRVSGFWQFQCLRTADDFYLWNHPVHQGHIRINLTDVQDPTNSANMLTLAVIDCSHPNLLIIRQNKETGEILGQQEMTISDVWFGELKQLKWGVVPAVRGLEGNIFSEFIDRTQDTFLESKAEIELRIAKIDDLINHQLNEILHHPQFKKLEAAWRGLYYLVSGSKYILSREEKLRWESSLERASDYARKVRIRVLNARKDELLKDFERAVEIENSSLFKKIYKEEYSCFGGLPFGALVGNYEFDHFPKDLFLLENIAAVSFHSKAPFISAPSPGLFYFRDDSFNEITDFRTFTKFFHQTQYSRWRAFRDSEKSTYVGLCLPRILLRDPHHLTKPFNFQESTENKDLLWGNAAFAFGACLVRAFNEKSWLGKMDGIGTDAEVTGLYFHFSGSDEKGEPSGFSLDESILEWARELSDCGFMVLIDEPSIDKNPYFFSSQSVHEPKKYDSETANLTARAFSQLENIFAASRFAIYLKCLRRDSFSFFLSRSDVERMFKKWLEQYYLDHDEASEEEKAQHPLREFNLTATEIPGKPGCYKAIMFIRPVYQLKEISIALRIEFDIPPPVS